MDDRGSVTGSTGRLLAVHAHPDDESSKTAATLARYVAEGAEVLVVSCTGGELGDVLNERLATDDPRAFAWAHRDMAGLRRHEMARARDIIGFEHRWLGFRDSGLPDEGDPVPAHSFAAIPLEHATAPLTRIIREFRPHVLITYDENGGYPHPDHIRTHEISMRAVADAAHPDHDADAGEPWQVLKVYYERTFNEPRSRAVLEELERRDPNDERVRLAAERLERAAMRSVNLTTHIECGEHFEARDAALRAHASQVPPDSPFFFWPNDVQRAAWPYEDYELVLSEVGMPDPDHPEDDLFARIDLFDGSTP